MVYRRSWSRIRDARLVRVLAVYLGASWLILQVTNALRDALELPRWVSPVAVLLLVIGLLVILATAWVQSHPLTAQKAQADEVPASWEFALGELKRSLLRGKLPHLNWARAIVGGLVAFSLLFGAAGLYVLLTDRGPSRLGPKEAQGAVAPGIAVLPFRAVGPGLELWREGMVDLLSTNLDGAAGLRAIDPRALLSRWRGTVGEGTEAPDRAVALDVARGLGATYGVIGSAVSLGGGVRLTAEIYALESEKLLGRAQTEGSSDSVLALVDRLSIEVLRAGLIQQGGELPRVDLSLATTSSLPALKAYLEGEQKLRRGMWKEAASDFARAVEADSTFALALHRLARAYGWIEGPSERVVAYSRRATHFADRLPERAVLVLRATAEYGEGHLQAIATFEELTRRYPDDAEGWYGLGEAYVHLGDRALEPRAQIRRALARALELDPGFATAYIHLIEDAIVRQDSVEARRLITAYRRIAPTDPRANGFSVVYAYLWGDSASRSQTRAALDTVDGEGLVDAMMWSIRAVPDLWRPTIELAQAVVNPRHPTAARRQAHNVIGLVHYQRGRTREAREAFAAVWALDPQGHPEIEEARWHFLGYLWGLVDAESARRGTPVLRRDPTPLDRFYLGALAAAEGRRSDVETELESLDSAAREAETRGESVQAMGIQSLAQALRCYAALRRGDPDAAAAEFQKPMPRLHPLIHVALRQDLGKAWLDRGDYRQAERYFQSLEETAIQAPAQFYLGQTYEALGDLERAKIHYARFVRWWEDCDPEFRPWLERGRQALERLARETRT